MGRPRLGGHHGQQAAAASGGRRHVPDRPAGRIRNGRRAYRLGDGRAGQRRGPARRVRRGRVPPGSRSRGDQDSPDTGGTAARVPFDRALHQRDQGAALPPALDGCRDPQQELRRIRDPVHAPGGNCRVAALPAVHMRGHRLLRPAAAGHRVRDDATDPRAGLSPGCWLPKPHGEPLHRHEPRLHPGRFARVHPARAVTLHRLRPLRAGVRGGGRRGVLRLHADRLRHAGHDASRHEPQRHALRVVRPLRRNLPNGRPDAQAARAPEIRRGRESLHPVRHLRRRLPL